MPEINVLGPGPRARHGSNIGQPMTRREGRLKVTGAAVFAADNHPPGLLHAVIVGSTIANGQITSLDTDAASDHPGVVTIMTPDNRPVLTEDVARDSGLDLLIGSRVRYVGQPIAVVIAETLEAATEGAALVVPRYEVDRPVTDFDQSDNTLPSFPGPELHVGDVDAGLASATTRLKGTFDTPAQYHNPLEAHSIVATWFGDRLEVDSGHQGIGAARDTYARIFGISSESVLVRSRFVGGGFGSKGFVVGPQVLGAMAARLVNRPVKLVLSRRQMFGPVGHRGKARQTIELGLDGMGRLLAVDHESKTATSVFADFIETAGRVTQTLYASPSLRTRHEAPRLHVGTPTYTRAPGEATGSAAIEIAMDEAAFFLNEDPLAYRLRNYSEVEPSTGKPFSSKALRECYAEGAAHFGWSRRQLKPRTMRDDAGFLVGWGIGTAIFPSFVSSAQARAILRADGTGVVQSSSADIGQGSWTALGQIAADSLGLDIDKVEFQAADSGLPDGGGAGGSAHTAGLGTAMQNAGGDAIAQLAAIATADARSPLYGAGNEGVIARDGMLFRRDDESRNEAYAEIMGRAGLAQIVGSGRSAPDQGIRSQYAMHAHGAVFAEVKVDPDLGQVRVTRLVGAFAAGRVINPHLVRSQYYGGMIWGLSFALHEEALVDSRTGRIMNADLAGYHVPVNSDVVSIETLLIEEHDPHVNGLGVKGVGEIGITGTVGAIANAVWHATGTRVHHYPIRIRDLISSR